MNTSMMKNYWRVVRHAFEMTIRQNMVDAFILFTIVVQPLIIALLALWMLQDTGENYAIFVVVGSGMSGLWSSLLFVSGNSINGERWTGTLESLVASPTPLQVVVFGKSMANVTQSLLSMIGSYILVSLIFGLPITIAQPAIFFPSIIVMMLSFMSFGLIIASIFIINPDVQRWQNGLEFPIFILSGFLFPITMLPGWTTPFSYLLTPYWAARILHASSVGTATLEEVALTWGMMILFGAIYVVISGRFFRRLLYKARVEATLGLQ